MQLIDPALDPWQPTPDAPEASVSPRAHALLNLVQWRAAQATWPATLPVGLALANTDDVEDLGSLLDGLALVTVHFPKFSDGRAYSQARLLRSRLRYRGPLRATGHVIADMLPLLWRCGVDNAVLSPGQSAQAAQDALAFFAEHYQGDVHRSQPLFRRAA